MCRLCKLIFVHWPLAMIVDIFLMISLLEKGKYDACTKAMYRSIEQVIQNLHSSHYFQYHCILIMPAIRSIYVGEVFTGVSAFLKISILEWKNVYFKNGNVWSTMLWHLAICIQANFIWLTWASYRSFQCVTGIHLRSQWVVRVTEHIL